MRSFLSRNRKSSSVAKERLKMILISERIDCTPQMMLMLKNDVIRTVSKYIPVDEEQVKIKFTQRPSGLKAMIPIHTTKDD